MAASVSAPLLTNIKYYYLIEPVRSRRAGRFKRHDKLTTYWTIVRCASILSDIEPCEKVDANMKDAVGEVSPPARNAHSVGWHEPRADRSNPAGSYARLECPLAGLSKGNGCARCAAGRVYFGPYQSLLGVTERARAAPSCAGSRLGAWKVRSAPWPGLRERACIGAAKAPSLVRTPKSKGRLNVYKVSPSTDCGAFER